MLLRRRWRVTAVQLDVWKGPAGAAQGAGILAAEIGQLAELQALELPGLGCARPVWGDVSVHSCLDPSRKLRTVGVMMQTTYCRVQGVASKVQFRRLPRPRPCFDNWSQNCALQEQLSGHSSPRA